MVKKYTIYMLLTLLIGCDICYWVPIDKMTYKDKFVYNNQIKINGYYLDTNHKPLNIYLTFYSNGLVYTFKSNSYDTTSFNYLARKHPWDWGFYCFDNDLIKCQFVSVWGTRGLHKYPIVDVWFKIINDSTLIKFNEIKGLSTEVLFDDTLFFQNDKVKRDSNYVFLRCIKDREMKKKKKSKIE